MSKIVQTSQDLHVDNYDNGLTNSPIPIHISVSKVDRLTWSFHKHDYMQLIYVYSGRVALSIDNCVAEAMKGDMIVVAPNMIHGLLGSTMPDSVICNIIFSTDSVCPSLDKSSYVLSSDYAYLEPFLDEKKRPLTIVKFSGMMQIEVENILNEARGEIEKKEPGYDIFVKALLLNLLVIGGRELEKINLEICVSQMRTNQREAILTAISYINENYKHNLSIEAVAKASMLSSSYFSNLFKTFTGTTFVEFLNRLRVQKALELLIATNLRVLDICHEVGFNNVSHFNKVFRRYMEVNPQYFRGKNIKQERV